MDKVRRQHRREILRREARGLHEAVEVSDLVIFQLRLPIALVDNHSI
jgi:hypothetical protein